MVGSVLQLASCSSGSEDGPESTPPVTNAPAATGSAPASAGVASSLCSDVTAGEIQQIVGFAVKDGTYNDDLDSCDWLTDGFGAVSADFDAGDELGAAQGGSVSTSEELSIEGKQGIYTDFAGAVPDNVRVELESGVLKTFMRPSGGQPADVKAALVALATLFVQRSGA